MSNKFTQKNVYKHYELKYFHLQEQKEHVLLSDNIIDAKELYNQLLKVDYVRVISLTRVCIDELII